MISRRGALVLLAACSLLDVRSARSTTLHVPADYATIQLAVGAATAGDTVEVACGTYYEHGVPVVREVIVRSSTGSPDCVTIDAGGVGSVFTCTGSGLLGLEGVAITQSGASAISVPTGRGVRLSDCLFRDNRAVVGAALHVSVNYGFPPPTVAIDRCSFGDNEATVRAGALYCPVNGGTTIRNSTFSANTAPEGGAALVGKPATVSDCTFESNTAGFAGALYTDEGVDVVGCTFVGNTATSLGGGALSYVGDGYGYAQAVDCTFRENTATTGGAVFMRNAGRGVLQGCLFEGNTATLGGALYVEDSVGRLEGCLLRHNRAERGGAVAVVDGSFNATGSVFFRNYAAVAGGAAWSNSHSAIGFLESTLSFNGTGGTGGGIWMHGGTANTLLLSRTIIAFSTPGAAVHRDAGTFSAVIRCTDLFGNGTDWAGLLQPFEGGNGNFSADPMFCDLLAGNMTLASPSPCAPDNSPGTCGLVGAKPVSCGTVSVERQTWAKIKTFYR